MLKTLLPQTIMAALAMTMFYTSVHADSDVTAETLTATSSFPSEWASDANAQVVALPSIAAITESNTFSITAYGASEDADDNASYIQSAIDAANSAGGGMVVVPAGTWLSGPLTMKSKVVFHICAGATLKLLPFGTYPSENEYQDYRGSYKNLNFIKASSAVNDVIIEGEGETSVIDGQGAPWWAAHESNKFDRPSLIRLQKGTRHLFRNFKMLNSPGTNLTLGKSGNANNMTVHDIIISAPKSGTGGSHNTDGIPIWGPYVNIYDCNISTGDDNIVVDSNGRYIHAWNITCGAGHGMSIGSYTEKVHHVIYEDIDFQDTETGFRIKTNTDRSGNDYDGTDSNGSVHDLIFRNSTMSGVQNPVVMTCLYDDDVSDPSTVTATDITYKTPEYRDFLFQNITATNPVAGTNFKRGNPIYIYGRPESYIHDITFDNVSIEAKQGMFMAYCEGINFINGCNIENTKGTGDFSMLYEASYTGSYDGTDSGTDSGTTTVVLSQPTCQATSGDASPWAFNGGYSISNANSKIYATSGSQYIKYSASVQYTITLPDGVQVDAIQFDGFDNYTDGDAYISEVNGTSYSQTDYVFPSDKSTISHKIDLATAASGTLTFTPKGKQICAAITLYITDATPLALTDGEEYTADEDKTYGGGVTYTRNFSSTLVNKWTSLYVPFAIDVAEYTDQFDIAEIFAFCPVYDTDEDGEVTADDDDYLIVFKMTSGTTVPNKPYLIRAKASGDVEIAAADNKAYAAPATNGSVNCATTKTKYTIYGTYSPVTANADNNYWYMSTSGSVAHKTSGSTTVKSNRWYMATEGINDNYGNGSSNNAKAIEICVLGEDVQTGIVNVNENDNDNENGNGNDNDNAIYTLGGVKVNGGNLPAGIYLKGGKAIVVK